VLRLEPHLWENNTMAEPGNPTTSKTRDMDHWERWFVIALTVLVTVLMIYFLVTKPTVWDKLNTLESRVQTLESNQK